MKNGVPAVCVPDPVARLCVYPYHDSRDRDRGGPHGFANSAADIDGARQPPRPPEILPLHPRPDVRESEPILGNLVNDFDFNQSPRPPVILPVHPARHPAPARSRDPARDAQALKSLHRLARAVQKRVERVGGLAEIVDRDVGGLQREPAQPADRGSLVAVGVAAAEHQADPERVVERDPGQLQRGGGHEGFVPGLERAPKPGVGVPIARHEHMFVDVSRDRRAVAALAGGVRARPRAALQAAATTRHATTRHATTRHATTRHATTRHATTRHATTCHAATCHDTTPGRTAAAPGDATGARRHHAPQGARVGP
jgi:hypothetical protein